MPNHIKNGVNAITFVLFAYFFAHFFITSAHEAQLQKCRDDLIAANSRSNIKLVLEKYASEDIVEFETVFNPHPINTVQYFVQSRRSWLFSNVFYKFEVVCNSETKCNFGTIQTVY